MFNVTGLTGFVRVFTVFVEWFAGGNTSTLVNLLVSYLVTIMGLVIPWSFTLALVDGYAVLVKCSIRQPGILLIIIVGDWVLSVLTLAAACSTVSVVDFLLQCNNGAYCPPKFCSRYQISAAMAFLSWLLSLASALFNLWLLPSL
ncbi:hypothetical protein I3760_06G141200 [Carya illinoinensis]|nr:hypothetical protein I3760_06G141200 [Carya illinoinensis]